MQTQNKIRAMYRKNIVIEECKKLFAFRSGEMELKDVHH